MQLIFISFLIVVFFISLIVSYHKDSKVFAGLALIIAIILGATSYFDGIDIKVGTNSTLLNDNRTIENVDLYEPVDVKYSRAIGLTFFIVIFFIGWILIQPGHDEDLEDEDM